MLTMPIAKRNQRPEEILVDFDRTRISILLIGQIAGALPDHSLLLSNDKYRVTSATDIRELSLLGATESFALSLISDTLGPTGLDNAARTVRKQWPSSRILVLGRASLILEDFLYDDALSPSCGQRELCDTLNKMSTPTGLGRPYIVTTPASEHDPLQRRPVSYAVDSRLPDVPERMTQTRF
jgi:hypothetical protein